MQRSQVLAGTTKLHHMKEDMGALDVSFSATELKEFRSELEKIQLIGVWPPESALVDQ
ncbi:MAG: hypothetical protein R3252_11850 [Robiginitalea sp.]|nr:hypothetical protein [Robiginitalea sp.]